MQDNIVSLLTPPGHRPIIIKKALPFGANRAFAIWSVVYQGGRLRLYKQGLPIPIWGLLLKTGATVGPILRIQAMSSLGVPKHP